MYQPRIRSRGNDYKMKIFCASGNAKAPLYEEEELTLRLTVYGIPVGTIVAHTEPSGNCVGNVALGARFLDGGAWETFARGCADDKGIYVTTGEAIDLAYQRLRMGDILPPEKLLRGKRTGKVTQVPAINPNHSDQKIVVDGERGIQSKEDNPALRVLHMTIR